MRFAWAFALLLLAAPAGAEIIDVRCPSGVRFVGDLFSCPCCKGCPDGSWHVEGEGSCEAAPGVARTEPAEPSKPAQEPLCSGERSEAGMALVSEVRKSSRDVLVNPLLWNGIDLSTREGFALWASKCLMSGKRISILHGKTGKTLATYSPAWGYSSKE